MATLRLRSLVFIVVALLLVGIGALFATGAFDSATPRAAGSLYVDPDSPAARQARQWEAEGRVDDARRISRLAGHPVPQWVTAPTESVAAQVDDYVERATEAGQEALLVAYHIPQRDCGSFSGGGAGDAEEYSAWIREVAAGLAGRSATVVVEPDAVPHALAGCDGSARPEDRFATLADAVDVLAASDAVTVYLDAGNPGFVTDVDALAAALRRSGVDRADGFSLNVANFYSTEENLAYGRRVSQALGGARFVVDTSRNGSGRVDGETVDGGPAWCNPPGRTVGTAPTTDTGDPLVAAFLWIKRPGESDGSCRPGEPPAGRWWPEYALALVPPT